MAAIAAIIPVVMHQLRVARPAPGGNDAAASRPQSRDGQLSARDWLSMPASTNTAAGTSRPANARRSIFRRWAKPALTTLNKSSWCDDERVDRRCWPAPQADQGGTNFRSRHEDG